MRCPRHPPSSLQNTICCRIPKYGCYAPATPPQSPRIRFVFLLLCTFCLSPPPSNITPPHLPSFPSVQTLRAPPPLTPLLLDLSLSHRSLLPSARSLPPSRCLPLLHLLLGMSTRSSRLLAFPFQQTCREEGGGEREREETTTQRDNERGLLGLLMCISKQRAGGQTGRKKRMRDRGS